MKTVIFISLLLIQAQLLAQEPIQQESVQAIQKETPLLVQKTEALVETNTKLESDESKTTIAKPVEVKVETKKSEVVEPEPKPVVKKNQKPQKPIGTIYVNDRLFLGVTRIPASGQQAIVTLKNGVAMQLLEKQSRYSKVRLEDGKEGWVRNLFISDTLPLSKQVPKLEKEKQDLQKQIESLKEQLEQKAEEQISPQEMFALSQEKLALQAKIDEASAGSIRNIVIAALLSIVALILGFVLGYGLLAKRVKEKFNGMKVW